MREFRSRTTMAEGMTIARRLRQLKRRTTRWFQPPIRSGVPESAGREPGAVIGRGLKLPSPLH
jgi:hypothetical protein